MIPPGLELHFPHMFPKQETCRDIIERPSQFVLRGDRGRIASECETGGDVLICDDEYLKSLISWVKWVELKFEMYKFKCVPPGHPENVSYDHEIFFKDGATELFAVGKHIKRLKANPVLFGDARVQERFMTDIGALFKQIQFVLKYCSKRNELLQRAETVSKTTMGASSLVYPESTQPIPPWETWCGEIDVNQPSATIQSLKDQNPGYQLVSLQQLPPQGVLIQEHWRKRLSQIVNDIAAKSQKPEVVLKQLPGEAHELDYCEQARKGKVFIKRIRKAVPPPVQTETNRESRAWGEQEPVAIGRSARAIAQLYKDCTTTGVPASVLSAFMVKDERDDEDVINGTSLNAPMKLVNEEE